MNVKFYPMSHRPKVSNDDQDYSVTVLVYDVESDFEDLGFFNFKDEEWHVLGADSMKLKCWSYIEKPKLEEVKNFKVALHYGYRD